MDLTYVFFCVCVCDFHCLCYATLNTCFLLQIFVGNLDLNVSEEELKQNSLQFGEIVSVKIQPGKGFGFVQFGTRSSSSSPNHFKQHVFKCFESKRII